MTLLKSRKAIAAALIGGLAVVGTGIAAFAYFNTTGGGTGTGSVGTNSALVLHQTAPVNSDYSSGDGHLYPGITQTVSWTVDNPSPGHQYLQNISLASWTSDKAAAGCDSAFNSGANAGWFTMPTVTVAHDYANGNGQTVTPTGVITFNNLGVSQDACKSATITFTYSSN